MIVRHLPKSCHPGNMMKRIDGVVIHFMSNVYRKPDDPFVLDDLIGLFEEYGVSAHFLIDRDGELIELLPLPKEAWHAGSSRMAGRNRCNDWTIGVELMGGTDFEYTPDQIACLKQLLARLVTEYTIPIENIQGHDQVRMAWHREYPHKKWKKKVDPGPHFPWKDVLDSLRFVDNGHYKGNFL